MDTRAVPGESGVPDNRLPVILLRVGSFFQFFQISSGVGD